MAILAVEAAVRVGRELGLPHAQRFVLFVYAFHANRTDGISWAKKETVAAETGLSLSTVTRAMHELILASLLVVHAYPRGGRGRSTEYRVLPGEWEPVREPDPPEDPPSTEKGVTVRGVSESGKGVTVRGVSDNPEKSERGARTDYPGKSEKGVTEDPKTPEGAFRSELRVIPGGKDAACEDRRAVPRDQPVLEPVQPSFARAREAEPLRGEGTASPSASETSPPWWDTPGVPPELRDTMRRVQARHGPPDVTGEDQPR